MKQYRVVLTGEAREIYIVEAESEEEAREKWDTGWLMVGECFGMDVDSVEEDDPDD